MADLDEKRDGGAIPPAPDVEPMWDDPALTGGVPRPARTTNLWKYKRAERLGLALAFVGRQVRLDRWYTRVADGGDETYHGVVLAVANSTIGTSADLLILRTAEGNTWAISLAQIAYIEASS